MDWKPAVHASGTDLPCDKARNPSGPRQLPMPEFPLPPNGKSPWNTCHAQSLISHAARVDVTARQPLHFACIRWPK